jgi:hypothetical protein
VALRRAVLLVGRGVDERKYYKMKAKKYEDEDKELKERYIRNQWSLKRLFCKRGG